MEFELNGFPGAGAISSYWDCGVVFDAEGRQIREIEDVDDNVRDADGRWR